MLEIRAHTPFDELAEGAALLDMLAFSVSVDEIVAAVPTDDDEDLANVKRWIKNASGFLAEIDKALGERG